MRGVMMIFTSVRKIGSWFSNMSLKVKFMLFYVLLVFLPMVFFLQWYSQKLMLDRQAEIQFEKQKLLEQSVKVFSNQLLETETVSTTFQSNAFLIKLLQNRYLSSSDELFSYLTNVLPEIRAIPISHPSIDEIFIYRYVDSALKDQSVDYYIVNIKDFCYNKQILEKVKQKNNVWFIEMNPNSTRHDTSYTAISRNPIKSPKLICFSRIYDESFSKIIGISELQVNLDSMIKSMNFFLSDESLYIKVGNQYYPITFHTNRSVQYDKPQESISTERNDGYGLAVTDLSGTNVEFIYQYLDTDIGNPVLFKSMLMAAVLLIIPGWLLLLYIYHFTGRLSKFSNHIKKMHGENLLQFSGGVNRDEFGIVVEEYNRMTQTISKLIQSVYQSEQQKNEANYYAMQSQVNPHFLFNTLENIRLQAELKEFSGVSEMLFALSRLLRYNISMRRTSTLLKELEHIQHYLLIFQYRQKNKVGYQIVIPMDFEDIECPFCILQPIVENCFKHGMKNQSKSLFVEITLKKEESNITVEIRDNGAGIPDDKLESINRSLAADQEIQMTGEYGSVGVKNVNSRLRIFYGDNYGISFAKNEPQGLICTMKLGLQALIDPQTTLHLGLYGKQVESEPATEANHVSRSRR